jgi:predicted dehydrogenase
MKVLVVGGGSMGTRHLNNLKILGLADIALVEPDPRQRSKVCEDGSIRVMETLEQGLDWSPTVAVVATPSYLHMEQALSAARAGCHLFVEKPLSHTKTGLDELAREVEHRSLISLVGCNMRFHPGPARVKSLLQAGQLGRILFGRIHTGSYLPGWRPQADYRKSYSAQAALGGGCILDCIHEIDLARWYLGDVDQVFCVARHQSSLEIDVEDVALLICKHVGQILSEIHLDFVQLTYERGCHIVGEEGSVFWDYQQGTVRWFDGKCKEWAVFSQPDDWNGNRMYLDELSHLLECVRTGARTVLPISEAVSVMEIALAAKESAAYGAFVSCRSEAG